jgi:methyl-accepting chemotaxis protein
MTIVGAIYMALAAATVRLIARSQVVTERTEKGHAIVDAVWQMADSFQHADTAGQMTEEEAKQRFFAAAGAVWYEGHTNYVFIYDFRDGNMRLESWRPDDSRQGYAYGQGCQWSSLCVDVDG